MVSVLITHYNRFEQLKECIDAFKQIDFKKHSLEIVVSDDCSNLEIQNQLKDLKIDQLILSDKNTGLASSLNRGIKACQGEFILYCQEDFIPQKLMSNYIDEAIDIMDKGKADMCRLKANYRFPKLIDLSPNFKLIPKFSWKNFYYNPFNIVIILLLQNQVFLRILDIFWIM